MNAISGALSFQLDFYKQVFGKESSDEFHAIVFGTEKAFNKYSKSTMDFNPVKENALAYFSPSENEMIMHLETEKFVKAFKHELSHAILHTYCNRVPQWLNEGLAVYMEDIDVEGGIASMHPEYLIKYQSVVDLLRDADNITLNSIVSQKIFGYQFSGNYEWENYELSWAVVNYLISVNENILHDMLTHACLYKYAWIEKIYPGGPLVLEADMKGFYLNQLPFEY